MLYTRRLLVMVVTLFTFRVVLQELGVDAYGVYNVVAGAVVLFAFMSDALIKSTQRYLSFNMGRGESAEVSRVFSMAIQVHILVCLMVILIAETVGLWFVETQMVFPADLRGQVPWVYQCAIICFLCQIMQSPYQAAIIASENMKFYAYVGVIEVTLKLLATFSLVLIPAYKLPAYSVMMAALNILIWVGYHFYCHRTFEFARYRRISDGSLARKLLSFSSWNILGSLGYITATQGVNVVLNFFFGVVVNAALGIAFQVFAAIYSFVINFQTAFNPQIIKSFAEGNREYLRRLVFTATRVSFMLVYVLGLPFIIYCQTILEVWLTDVPEYTVWFIQLMVVYGIIESLSAPMYVSIQATGRIGTYMVIECTLNVSCVLAAYLLSYFGYSPVWAVAFRLLTGIITWLYRMVYLYFNTGFPAMRYIRQVVIPLAGFVMLSAPSLWALSFVPQSIMARLGFVVLTVALTGVLGYLFALKPTERQWLRGVVTSKMHNPLRR